MISEVVPGEDLQEDPPSSPNIQQPSPKALLQHLRRILTRSRGASLEMEMALETEGTVRGVLDPDTARRIKGFG